MMFTKTRDVLGRYEEILDLARETGDMNSDERDFLLNDFAYMLAKAIKEECPDVDKVWKYLGILGNEFRK